MIIWIFLHVATQDQLLKESRHSPSALLYLKTKDTIIFTDGKGIVYEYETVQTETVDGRDVEAMELGSENNWDLTLFTCTLSGQSRVTVRAVQTNN